MVRAKGEGPIPDDVYRLWPKGPAPAGVPGERVEDVEASEPFAPGLAARRAAFFAHVLRTPPPEHLSAVYHELARFAAGGPLNQPVLEAALDHIDGRLDCADFVLHAILRLLFQFGGGPRLPAKLRARARDTVLGFKYWPDEPGADSLCTWTENHQILFAGAALLAGQLYPDATFANSGLRGRDLAARARPRIDRWLALRFRTGFSEWLSHVYYDEDMTALTNLVDFAADEELSRRCSMVLDLLLLDIVLGSFRGVFGTTHGRSYEGAKKWSAEEGTSDTAKLLFGTGCFGRRENMSAVCLALSERYRVPAVLEALARDAAGRTFTSRQRMGIRLAEAARWGLGRDLESGMVMLSLEAYAHPRSIELVMEMFDAFRWWENDFFRPFAARRGLVDGLRRLRLLPALAWVLRHDLTRNLREEVHITTYRTPDYMLSSAVDWRKGYGGDQQHLWQATLGPDAVCFTTHPGPRKNRSPGHWTGSGLLPRVGQVENVLFAVYRIRWRPAVYVRSNKPWTHAWLPRDRFDDVKECGGWAFARKGDGYLALRASQPWEWQREEGEDCNRELVAQGADCVWICECGRRADHGSFDDFAAAVSRAPVQFDGTQVIYGSPSQGQLEFGWKGPLRRDGAEVPLGGHPRYDNPYVKAPFPAEEIEVRQGGAWLRLRWRDGVREASGFLEPG